MQTDVEDLLPLAAYLDSFNAAFAKQLGVAVTEADLPAGDRIIDRLERWLKSRSFQLRADGTFSHHLVATKFTSAGPVVDTVTLDRFEALFKAVNAIF